MGYVLLFILYILLVFEFISMDVQINLDFNIKIRNYLIYECILGLFFQIINLKFEDILEILFVFMYLVMFVFSNSFCFEFYLNCIVILYNVIYFLQI